MLLVSGVVVLAYSLWVAWDRGKLSGFDENKLQALATHTGPPVSPAGVAVRAPIIDAISHATPQGGIKFVGGAKAPHLHTAFNTAADIIRPCVVNVSAAAAPGRPAPVGANAGGARFIPPFDGTPDKVVGQLHYENVGSGLIIDPAGYIVTNHHVVVGSTSIVVSRFHKPGEHLVATVVATDRSGDLAVLKITGSQPFPSATFADSALVEVGDWVLAVGNPFGLEHTVTAGIVGAKRSTLTIEGLRYSNLFQTDAPINRGSSGGPLVNLSGHVIGINTAIWAPNGVFSGAGFAIPSNRVRSFVAGVLRKQPATAPGSAAASRRGYIGIGVIDVTPDLARKLSYKLAGGVFVSSVVLDSPADEAEITRGDIIISMAGEPIRDQRSLRNLLARLSPGHTVPVTYWQAGKTKQTRLTITTGRRAGQ